MLWSFLLSGFFCDSKFESLAFLGDRSHENLLQWKNGAVQSCPRSILKGKPLSEELLF